MARGTAGASTSAPRAQNEGKGVQWALYII